MQISALPAALAAFFILSLTPASFAESSFKGTCKVVAGTTGGAKYATLKCHQAGKPGSKLIRRTVWEKRIRKAISPWRVWLAGNLPALFLSREAPLTTDQAHAPDITACPIAGAKPFWQACPAAFCPCQPFGLVNRRQYKMLL